MVDTSVVKSRMLGSLWGMAVGDALGGPYEFQSRGTYTPSSEMKESYTFMPNNKPLPAGSWTDDTSMALCMAVSLIEKHEFVWTDVASRWIRWKDDGYMSVVDVCFDMGLTTRVGLDWYRNIRDTGTPAPKTPRVNSSPNQSGNGSIMRLAPIPVFFAFDAPKTLYENSADSSGITHGSTMCLDGCILMSTIIVGFLHCDESWSLKKKKEAILSRDLRLDELIGIASSPENAMSLSSPQMNTLFVRETYKTKPVGELRTSGFVLHTLEAALWALWRAETFEQGLLELLPLGEDVDTVCAVYGAIAGACFGYDAIQKNWIDRLQRKEDILTPIFTQLVDAAFERGQMLQRPAPISST